MVAAASDIFASFDYYPIARILDSMTKRRRDVIDNAAAHQIRIAPVGNAAGSDRLQ